MGFGSQAFSLNDSENSCFRHDRWRCQSCGARSNLEVHYQEFRSHGGDDSEENLISLCAACYSLVHRWSD